MNRAATLLGLPKYHCLLLPSPSVPKFIHVWPHVWCPSACTGIASSIATGTLVSDRYYICLN